MRWFASPHLPLALPPRIGRPCTCAMPHTRGGEMRESETRLRNARRACTCFPESDDTCAPVRVATSRVDPPATRWPTMHSCATPHKGSRNSRWANCLRRRAIALRHSCRLCAATGTPPPLFLDGRKTVASTACATCERRSRLRSRIRISRLAEVLYTRHWCLHRRHQRDRATSIHRR